MSPEELPENCQPEVKICEDWKDETEPEKDPSDDQIEICCRPSLVDCDNATDQKTVNVFIELGDSVLKGRKNNDSLCPDQKPPKECQDLLDKNLILLIDAKFDNPPRKGEEVPPAGCDGADSTIPKDKDDSINLGFPMRIPLGNLKNLMDDAIKANPEDGGGDPCSDPTNTNRSIKIPLFSQSFPFKRTNCLPKACANAKEFHEKFCFGNYPNNQWTDQEILQWFTKYKEFLKTKGLNIINFFPFIPPGKNDSKRCVGVLCFKTDGNGIPPSTGFSELCNGALNCSGPWLSEIGDPPQDLKDCFNKKNPNNPVNIDGWNCPSAKMRQLCNMLKCIESKDPGGAQPDGEDPSVAIVDISATLITEDGKKSKNRGDCLDNDSPRMEITTGENGSSTDMVIRIGGDCQEPLKPYGIVFWKDVYAQTSSCRIPECGCESINPNNSYNDISYDTPDLLLNAIKNANRNKQYGDFIPCASCEDTTSNDPAKATLKKAFENFCGEKPEDEIGYCCEDVVRINKDGIYNDYPGAPLDTTGGYFYGTTKSKCCNDELGANSTTYIFYPKDQFSEEEAKNLCQPKGICCIPPTVDNKGSCFISQPTVGSYTVKVSFTYNLYSPNGIFIYECRGNTGSNRSASFDIDVPAKDLQSNCDPTDADLGNYIKNLDNIDNLITSTITDEYNEVIKACPRVAHDVDLNKVDFATNAPNSVKSRMSFSISRKAGCTQPYSLLQVSAVDAESCQAKAQELIPCCGQLQTIFVPSVSIGSDGKPSVEVSINNKTGVLTLKNNPINTCVEIPGGYAYKDPKYICEIEKNGKLVDAQSCASNTCDGVDHGDNTQPEPPSDPTDPGDVPDPKTEVKKCAKVEISVTIRNREFKKIGSNIQFPYTFTWNDTTIVIENQDDLTSKFKSLPFPARKAFVKELFGLNDDDFTYKEPFSITPADCADSPPKNPRDIPVNPTDPNSKDRDPTDPKNKEECASLLKELELANAEVNKLTEQLKAIEEDFKDAKTKFVNDCIKDSNPIVRGLPWGSILPWSKECQALIDKMLNNFPGGNFKLPSALSYIKPPPKVSKKYKKAIEDLSKAKDKARELDLEYQKCIKS